ncbi:MAG: hypothetical protein PHP95_12105 [Desulfuromonadaceae bacterium]|nr:hypothetical protein [Desulfuromonadaceae bacterium]MDD2849189.1 hypothetical protein [Desulfuromonadaceae bacterium]
MADRFCQTRYENKIKDNVKTTVNNTEESPYIAVPISTSGMKIESNWICDCCWAVVNSISSSVGGATSCSGIFFRKKNIQNNIIAVARIAINIKGLSIATPIIIIKKKIPPSIGIFERL